MGVEIVEGKGGRG